MVLSKKVFFLIGNEAEIRPLEMDRKGPENCTFGSLRRQVIFSDLLQWAQLRPLDSPLSPDIVQESGICIQCYPCTITT